MAVTVAGAGVAQAAPPPLPNVLPKLPALPPIPGLPTPGVDLSKSFETMSAKVVKKTPGRIGVAITATGSGEPLFFGTVKTARAWSTLKAPVAVAAERKHVKNLVAMEDKSIRDSDNASAEAIWGALGSTQQAIDAVTAVLREGGDARTQIASELSRPRSYPGATQWATADQSVFAANLPCVADSHAVLRNMSRVGPNQQWGVAKGRKGVDTAVKGGWGPVSDATGKYVVRQLATVTTSRGIVGVSLVAIPRSGTFEDGTAMLTSVGNWVQRNLKNLPAGQCPPVAL
ncbi:hypothetical protein [Gordonia hydrophobica]|uniref:Secreted protein n=1 Tax=Gordonia hydrophobica TaxID=40516 RepID=A0ABZ2U2W6_9ACTN|nr:hypothetical protein [Gordonia hydrophobica]MBM7369019.1 hypothetical protein [Gordonia hydrophobica]